MIHIRRVPFVENGEIVGLCAKGDLAKVNIHVNEAGEALSHLFIEDIESLLLF
ncbi:hypothetical protein JFV29_11570 [Peribacillus sp. TH16]|uniref:hypothetical protein n=1 Tax=Peribacillus TaxID=2675229 RepID=UPI000AB1235E|nr:hypothetical protein [Peribacillus sp. TH16]MBK5482536.1 hypothetical protein [Peribacillus sp. TH16]